MSTKSTSVRDGLEVFPRFRMSAERYVMKASSEKAHLGSKFTLTLIPSTETNRAKGNTDENFNFKPDKEDKETNKTAETKQEVDNNNRSEVDEKFLTLFKGVAGEDLEIDAFELHKLLGSVFKRDFGEVKDFSIECCRSLIVMVDRDRSGKLDFAQFKDLFQWLMEKRKVYKKYENNQSWDMDAADLKDVIASLGFEICEETINLLAVKYRNRRQRINFDDFLQICARVQSCHDSYCSYQTVGDTFDEFAMHVIYT